MPIVPRERHEAIARDLSLPVSCCPNWRVLAQRYPEMSMDALVSIFCAENQYRVIKSHHIHKSNMPYYCARYKNGEDILELCCEVDFPPCLMVRRMMEHMLRMTKQRVGDIIKQPSLLDPSTCAAAEGADPALLARLRNDINRCVRADRSYSPFSDAAKELAGLEHEALLYDKLKADDVAFWTEEELRAKGMFKTPDARLQVPIALRACEDSPWRIVQWIDSKATFGDDRTHSAQLDAQYRTYTNRYGSGLVIYWFGYIQELEDSDPQVMLLEDWPQPQNIKQLPRLLFDPGAAVSM